MKKIGEKKLLVLILIFAVTLSSYGNVSQAASKQYVKSLKLSKSTVSMKEGERIKIKTTVKVSGKAKKRLVPRVQTILLRKLKLERQIKKE